MSSKTLKIKKRSRFSFKLNFKIIAAVIVTLISLYVAKYLPKYEKRAVRIVSKQQAPPFQQKVLKYWGVCIHKWNPKGNLRTMNRVFRKIGYKFVNGTIGDEYDLNWSIEYQFFFNNLTKNDTFYRLKDYSPLPHQRYNHIPGISSITNKRTLGELSKSKYLLKSFSFPKRLEEFKSFIKKYPDKKILEKNYHNRGVKIINIDEVNYTDTKESKKIYQVFMDKPFLIDGHAFDFGVFVLISSINPLRIYRYDHEVFIRFCPEQYLPFDANNRRKYVVDESHLSAFDMPSFQEIHRKYEFSFKSIFEHIISKRGFNIKSFWSEIDNAIVNVIKQNEKFLVQQTQKLLKNSHHFFELVRFDIILDKTLHPYVMEVNMSPNLTPTQEKHEEYALTTEQVVYNTLQLLSASSYDDFMSRFSNDSITTKNKNIAINLNECLENECTENCDNPACEICLPCVNEHLLFHMRESYREHLRRGNFKRVFPALEHFDNAEILESLNANNKIMLKWFHAQCKIDKNWC